MRLAMQIEYGSFWISSKTQCSVLGNHAAGKSSLVNYLIGDSSEGSTHILRIKNYRLPDNATNNNIPDVIFYDFGGQDFYHGIYQVFISPGAFQLIVFDTRKDKNVLSWDRFDNYTINYNRQYWLGHN
jgi:internalin A